MTTREFNIPGVNLFPTTRETFAQQVLTAPELRRVLPDYNVGSTTPRFGAVIESEPIRLKSKRNEVVAVRSIINLGAQYEEDPFLLCDIVEPLKSLGSSPSAGEIMADLMDVVAIEDEKKRIAAQVQLYNRYPLLGFIADNATKHSVIRLTNTHGRAAECDQVDTSWLKCQYSPDGTMRGWNWGDQKEMFGTLMRLPSGVRERKETFKELVEWAVGELISERVNTGKTDPIELLDIAGGACDYGAEGLRRYRERSGAILQDYLESVPSGLRLMVSDGSRRALDYSRKLAMSLGVADLMQGSLGDANKIEGLFEGRRAVYGVQQKLDMIISSGFMDYLPYRQKIMFVRAMRDRLKLGGIYGNANIGYFDKMPDTSFSELDVMERGLRWLPMLGVNEEELVRLHLEAGFHPHEINAVSLPSGRISMVVARKIERDPYIAFA